MNENQETKQSINLFKDMERETIISSLDPDNALLRSSKKPEESKTFISDKLGEELKI